MNLPPSLFVKRAFGTLDGERFSIAIQQRRVFQEARQLIVVAVLYTFHIDWYQTQNS